MVAEPNLSSLYCWKSDLELLNKQVQTILSILSAGIPSLVAHTSSIKIKNSDDLSHKLPSSKSTIMSDFRLTHPNSVPIIELIGFELWKKSTTDPDVSAHYRVSSSVPTELIFDGNDTRERSKTIGTIPIDWFRSSQDICHKSLGIFCLTL
jgi:hypothetical protein